MTDHLVRQLHHIRRDLEEKTDAIIRILWNHPGREHVMSLALDIKAIGVRIDAVTAALPNDVGTAVAAQKATDDAANAQNIQAVADAQGAVTALSAQVAALEAAAGVTQGAPPPAALTVTPTSISGPVGTAITQALTVTGGTGPYTIAIDPAAPAAPGDVGLSGNSVTVGGQTAEAGSISVIATDSSSPPVVSASTAISISIA